MSDDNGKPCSLTPPPDWKPGEPVVTPIDPGEVYVTGENQ